MMEDANNQVDYNDLSVVVIQLWELKIFLESLESEREKFLDEKREELIDNLNSMEYLLKIVYLFTDVEVEVQDEEDHEDPHSLLRSPPVTQSGAGWYRGDQCPALPL